MQKAAAPMRAAAICSRLGSAYAGAPPSQIFAPSSAERLHGERLIQQELFVRPFSTPRC
jgi:hypothetical protein